MSNALKAPLSGEKGYRMIPLRMVRPAEYNPRKKLNPDDEVYQRIRASIESFGLVEPLVVNKDMTLISGHQRFGVMCDMGYEEIPCVVLDLNKEQEKTLNIAMNKISGEWDKDLLAELLVEIQNSDIDSLLTGFSYKELDTLSNYYYQDSCEEDHVNPDPFLRNDYIPVTELGDIWYLGEHKVLCADSTKPESYEQLMDGRQAQLILTDPPYGTKTVKTGGPLLNDDLCPDKYKEFLVKVLMEMKNALAGNGTLYMFCASETMGKVVDAFGKTGWHISSCCVWIKDEPVFGYADYNYGHENIIYGWPDKRRHNWYGNGINSTVWYCERPHRSIYHSTVKPLKLLQIPIGNSSARNQIVLDPFLGSGSTMIACDQMNRICYGMELDRRYVDLTVIRYLVSAGMNMDGITLERNGTCTPLKNLERCTYLTAMAESMKGRGCVGDG